MIIVIGMDNTGKTTLVKALAEELNLPTVKSPGPKSKAEQMRWVLKQTMRDTIFGNTIYERFALLEELVYGQVLRNESNFKYDDEYFQLLRMADPIIVYVRPSNEKIFNFGDRPQFSGIIENKDKLLAAFDELVFKMISSGWKVLTYNYEYHKVKELAKALKVYKLIEGGLK
jgi:hypothetical protein